jgi:hypothetical protein
MAYKILKDEYYQPDLGLFGPGPLGIRYDPVTGDYELKQKGALGYDVGIGLAIFFKNGSWTSDAIRDPKLFVDGDPNKPTQLAKDLSIDINKKAYAAYQTLGGSAKSNKINAAAQPQNQGRFIVNNAPAGAGPPPSLPGIGSALSAPPGQGNFFDPGLNLGNNKNFQSKNEKELFKGLLKYPKDILDNQQDTLHITMFNYKPPLEDLFESKTEISKIFTEGVQRNSALKGGLKESIGTVILPIPSGISDSNNVEWGDDRMNNMTMAATGFVGSKLGQVAGQQLLTEVANLITSLKGNTSLPTGGINQAALLAQMGALDFNNPDVKSSLMSLVLKKAGFEVSPESILARGAGVVPNSNLELLFKGPTLRQFQFAYRFSPRSKPEAADVRRIIRFFKQGSAARKLNATKGAGYRSVFLGSPNVFKLEYKTVGGKSIAGVNKFKICALQGVSVNYAPDGQWSAYEEGQPVSYTMSLGFQEIEPIYESDYQDTIFDDLSGDYDKITENDIGY